MSPALRFLSTSSSLCRASINGLLDIRFKVDFFSEGFFNLEPYKSLGATFILAENQQRWEEFFISPTATVPKIYFEFPQIRFAITNSNIIAEISNTEDAKNGAPGR